MRGVKHQSSNDVGVKYPALARYGGYWAQRLMGLRPGGRFSI